MARHYYRVDAGDERALEDFSEDVTLDVGPFGQADGRDEVAALAERIFGEEVPFARHMIHSPLIEVDGDRATGRWYADIPATGRRSGSTELTITGSGVSTMAGRSIATNSSVPTRHRSTQAGPSSRSSTVSKRGEDGPRPRLKTAGNGWA